MRIPNPYAHYPPAWADFDCRATLAHHTGQFANAASVNRFAARYRLAHAFRGLDLDGYTAGTKKGYEALTKVVLAWSAVESLLRAIGTDTSNINAIRGRIDHDSYAAKLRACDGENKFLRFVRGRLTKTAQIAEFDQYLKGKSCCVVQLARGVRHIYAHGPLTPNANSGDADTAAAICGHLSDAMFTCMDAEFSDRVAVLVEIFPDTSAPDQDDDIPF